ncbi:MAG: tRNA (guanosine(46)-N7)-methyltransferase TrmB [Planctomycetaceae bacterium]|jgi:tRNA (guanine-N7-)-methyltransferase|nr:tRNA (guanosine(46)-N7)-methyltransferase TrmB [Planctomycetaceae bacterium]
MRKRSHIQKEETVDLSLWHFLPPDLPDPTVEAWNVANIFPEKKPIELEIGSGKGLFLKNAAKSFPERNFLGIEISKKYARLIALYLAHDITPNAAVVCGDAVLVLQNSIPDAFLAAVHIYFPDPWWKNKHSKRRIVCPSVVKLIHQKLISGGKFHFWTDVEPYFRKGLEVITAVSELEGPFDVPVSEPEHDFDYRTHFERRTCLNGEPVFRSLFVKK